MTPITIINVYAGKMLAERVGFEPTLEFPLNTLSKRAPSATRPSLRLKSVEGTTLSEAASRSAFNIFLQFYGGHPRNRNFRKEINAREFLREFFRESTGVGTEVHSRAPEEDAPAAAAAATRLCAIRSRCRQRGDFCIVDHVMA